MLSHELRQPLGALQAATWMLRPMLEGDDPARRERVVAAMERNVSRLVDLITRITQISGMAGREHLPSVQRTSLTTVARESARQLRDVAAERGVEVRIADDLPDVTVDFGELELLLVNLLSNAIKYMDPSKSVRFVEVSTVPSSDDRACAAVRDSSLGMDAAQLEQLFTPLFRAHAERDTELGIEGLGLGLTIVRDCARRSTSR